jgi:hypothetical protein
MQKTIYSVRTQPSIRARIALDMLRDASANYSHKLFKKLAKRGKISVGGLGFQENHRVVNEPGQWLAFHLTPGN